MKEFKSVYEKVREQLEAEGRIRVFTPEESTALLIEINKEMQAVHKGQNYPRLMLAYKDLTQ